MIFCSLDAAQDSGGDEDSISVWPKTKLLRKLSVTSYMYLQSRMH